MQNQYTVDACDLSCYGDYRPPNLDTVIVYAQAIPQHYLHDLCYRVDHNQRSFNTVHDPEGGGSKVNTYHRSSQGVVLDPDTYNWFKKVINDNVQYHLAHHLVERFQSVRLTEQIQFLRYDSSNGGRFRRHWDDAYYDDQGVFRFTHPQRKFVAITLLNDDYEGGELVLDTVKKKAGGHLVLKPAAGSMIIFPSDQRFPHEVRPVTKGVRRSVVAWFDLFR